MERKETRGEGDHTDETLELPAERGRQERLLWVLLHEQGLTHTMYFAKSSSPDAPNQQKKKKKQARQLTAGLPGSQKSPVPGGWPLGAVLEAKLSPCSAQPAAHNLPCWRPGQHDACEMQGQEPSNPCQSLAALAGSALLSATASRRLKYCGISDCSSFFPAALKEHSLIQSTGCAAVS